MSNKHHLQANSFGSNDGENIVVREVKITLDQGYSAAQFDDNDLIQKQAVVELIGGAAVVAETIVIPSGTPLTAGNFTIPYAPYTDHGNYPRFELEWLNPDTGNWDIQYTGISKEYVSGDLTNLILFLTDDGSGNTYSDYVLVIQ